MAERLALRINEVAECLGVSRDTIERLAHRGELTTFTIGTARFVSMRELERFIEQREADSSQPYWGDRHTPGPERERDKRIKANAHNAAFGSGRGNLRDLPADVAEAARLVGRTKEKLREYKRGTKSAK